MTLASRHRSALIFAILGAGLATFAWSVHGYYPLSKWLFFRYLGYWALCLVFAAASLTSGFRLLSLLGGQSLRFTERLLLGFSLGVLTFGLGVFTAGMLGAYGALFFVVWPLALLASGGSQTPRTVWRGVRRLFIHPTPLTAHARSAARGFTPSEWARLAFLGLGLIAVYTQVMTPENVSFDARWYHLSTAEQYAYQGGIRRFADGWYLAAYPQLATWLYTWAFQQPSSLFDRVMLSAHVEWTLFLATIVGIGPLVRRLIPGPRLRWAGAAFFLFPSALIYNSNLNAGADRVLAFWAAPLAIAIFASRRAVGVRSVTLVATMAAGAILTKYQAIYLIVPASVAMVWVLVRAKRLDLLLYGTAALLVLTMPHWLKNALFYGDPFYPILNGVFAPHPFHAGAKEAMEQNYVPRTFALEGPFLHKLKETAKAVVTFSFVPNNWKSFNIPEPTFGSLFTLLTPTLLFVERARRTAALTAATSAGVAVWFWTNHQDRFLQALVPWMAACVAALSVFRAGRLPQVGLIALISFQAVWGADAYFYPTNGMIKVPLVHRLGDFVAAGHLRQFQARFNHWGEMKQVGAALPRDATVLLHDRMLRLGLGRPSVTDHFGFQGALSYVEFSSARKVWQAWRALGASHVAWNRPDKARLNPKNLARQLVFFDAVGAATENAETFGKVAVAKIRETPPAERARLIRIAGCRGRPSLGVYEIRPTGERTEASPFRARSELRPEDVTLVAVRLPCALTDAENLELSRDYRRLGEVSSYVLWTRSR